MEIGIKVIAEDLQSKEMRHTNTCYFTMVAVDEAGKPIPVPELIPETEKEKERFEFAFQCRQQRFAQQKLYTEQKKDSMSA